MTIPYRTRSFLKRLVSVLLVICVVFVSAILCGFAWLGRFVVYSRVGALFDFTIKQLPPSTAYVQPPEESDPVSIYYNEGSNAISTGKELTQMIGYYVTAAELEQDLSAVQDKIRTLPKDTPIMLDMKSIYGNFFYSSSVSENRNTDLDIEAMDELLAQLKTSGYYTIARVPALRDRLYGLEHVGDGLPVAAGYLWMDDYGCYWLNPSSDGTVSYLVQIANELKNLGFDEVVFYDFYIPTANSIVFKSDRSQALSSAAQTLVNTCATDKFAVSFTYSAEFEIPEGRSRVYLEDTAAANAALEAGKFGFEDPQSRVVFLTDIHDTRFDDYSVLRPIADAQ